MQHVWARLWSLMWKTLQAEDFQWQQIELSPEQLPGRCLPLRTTEIIRRVNRAGSVLPGASACPVAGFFLSCRAELCLCSLAVWPVWKNSNEAGSPCLITPSGSLKVNEYRFIVRGLFQDAGSLLRKPEQFTWSRQILTLSLRTAGCPGTRQMTNSEGDYFLDCQRMKY